MDVAAKRNPVEQHMARPLKQMDLQHCLLADLLRPVKKKSTERLRVMGRFSRSV
jgi:hypothetical protein